MTPDVDEERGVVDDRAHFLVEAHALRQFERDEALAEHVLHGLAKPEIDPERQGRHELREAELAVRRFSGHVRHLPPISVWWGDGMRGYRCAATRLRGRLPLAMTCR